MARKRKRSSELGPSTTLTSSGIVAPPASVIADRPPLADADLPFAKTEQLAPPLPLEKTMPLGIDTLPPARDAAAPKDVNRALPVELQERFIEAKVLGSGGMGTVFQARDKHVGRDVAIKLLHPGNPHLDENLFREARSQAKLEHQHICKIYEVGSQGEHRYLVMQLIQGIPLDEAKANMTLEQKVRIVQTIALALHEVHRHGFIHRDVKPSNIMVEYSEDGTVKPYLMDFGLAREVGAQGKTVTGIIAGTPSYMAPEQARGEIRQLDRRTDVYSLGATLYDLLAGRPPFVATDVWSLLYDLQLKEPTQLRTVDKTIPVDIATIVMKSIEKEPQHRYDSAKALADDLLRFLDGESVRRASLFFLAYKKAKRNKPAVALISACLVLAIVLGSVWVKARRAAEQQAIFSRELGETIKEMELFLRTTHELPTHDIERDRHLIRLRLAKVESRMNALGTLGVGPGHYAMGRGHLGLQEYERARDHLQKAIDSGYASPDLDYAMGMTLGELYRKGLEEVKRIENPDRKKARVEQLNAELKEPALRRLSASLGGEPSSAAYVRGLIAFYSDDHEAAKKYAQEAFVQEPWLYEAKRLEADAFFAQGSSHRHDKKFDYEKMMGSFQPAADAFVEAMDIGRSDPRVFLAACEFWRQWLTSVPQKYDVGLSVFTKADAVCARGIRSAPGAIEPRVYAALLYQVWSHKLLFSTGAPLEEAVKYLKEAVTKANEAVTLGPNDSMAHYVKGTTLLNQFYYENDRGMESLPAVTAAAESLTKASTLDSSFLWAHNEACKAFGNKARRLSSRGIDPKAAVSDAIAACDRAIQLDSTWAFPHMIKAQAYLYRAMDEIQYGLADDASFEAILRSLEEAKKINPGQGATYGIFARSHYYHALSEMNHGRDPVPFLLKAEQYNEELRALYPTTDAVAANIGLISTLHAKQAMNTGKDPAPWLEKARDAFEQVTKSAPWDIYYRIYRAQADILSISWALKQGQSTEKIFDDALAPLVPLLGQSPAHPEFYQKLGNIYALKAAWLWSQKKNPDQVIDQGLHMIEKALAIHPRLALALATKGQLLSLRAKTMDAGSDRLAAEDKAKITIRAALEENPLIERDSSDE